MTVAPLFLLALQAAASATAPACPTGSTGSPHVVAYPEPGLDDPAAYEGYRTRFFRDAAGNTVQVYVKEGEGRVVNLWADAADESIGFTARAADGTPARLDWEGDSACVSGSEAVRSLTYRLRARTDRVQLGHFVLGSMRFERDVQYGRRHLEPLGSPIVLPELEALVDRLAGLPEPERSRHLAALDAADVAVLRSRLRPEIHAVAERGREIIRVERPSLDGRNRLILDLSAVDPDVRLAVDGTAVRITAPRGVAPVLELRLSTDATPLTPVPRDEIFNARFLAWLDSDRAAHDRAVAVGDQADPAVARYRRLERQARALELVTSREKLFAGLPNYATYFGRDLMVSALLMQPIWVGSMNEHVIGSVLRKLAPDGQVSHEEALGGQAIREHAAEYVALIDSARARTAGGDPAGAAEAVVAARAILGHMQRVRENYAMVDDEYMLPVLTAVYLSDDDVPADRKRAFLLAPADPTSPDTRLARLLANLALVADQTAAYVADPVPANLVAFDEREPGVYRAASWRDSGAGYGNGRYAMDVNAVWVPRAIEGLGRILERLDELRLDPSAVRGAGNGHLGTALARYVRDPASLDRAIDVWNGARRHFTLRLTAAEARARIDARIAAMPAEDGAYWRAVLDRAPVPPDGIEFAALSLDGDGRPIGIVSTDIATLWFLDDVTGRALGDPAAGRRDLEELETALLPYPVGLFVDDLGPLAANDAYATPDVWAAFERDDYHSPRVVWGREVNLLLSGLMRQIDAAHRPDGSLRDARLGPFVDTLQAQLVRIRDAVERSGLGHNELWSYRVVDGRLVPIRWGASTDIQLWNLTSLAVDMLLESRERR